MRERKKTEEGKREGRGKREDKIKIHFNRWSTNNSDFIVWKNLTLLWSVELLKKKKKNFVFGSSRARQNNKPMRKLLHNL